MFVTLATICKINKEKNKVLMVRWKEKNTRYVKIICIASIMDQSGISLCEQGK